MDVVYTPYKTRHKCRICHYGMSSLRFDLYRINLQVLLQTGVIQIFLGTCMVFRPEDGSLSGLYINS